jgi:copper resistance protein B
MPEETDAMRLRTGGRGKLDTCVAPVLIAAWASLLAGTAGAMGDDDPLLGMVIVDKAEYRKTSGHDHFAWEADAWLGRDLDKLWLKTEGENSEDRTEEAELQLLYSRAVTTNWDLQVGWRGDFQPDPRNNWLVAGFRGMAPYRFDVDIAGFVGGSGRTSIRATVEYEILFTQRLVLVPELEIDWYGKDDPDRVVGSGLSSVELGLRLRYEIRREIAPYLGINWWSKLGDTDDIAHAAGDETDDLEIVLGLRAWF